MNIKRSDQIVRSFLNFRRNMNLGLTLSQARYIWGRKAVEELPESVQKKLERSSKLVNRETIERKINIAKINLKNLLVFNWVKFVGISGSVAAGFAKDEDDIDVFIVVQDGCSWIYRGILTVRNIFMHTNRTQRDGEKVKDLFCINFIVEERGLELNSDIFNLHELMYLIPLYNPNYINFIYSKNEWLVKKFLVNKNLLVTRITNSKRVGIFIRIINFFAFVAQFAFTFIRGHMVELEGRYADYKRGRIVFYPKDFKKKVLKELKSV